MTSRRLDCVDAVERPQRVQPRPPVWRALGLFLQRRNADAIAALDEQLLRRVAPPAVRMREPLDELRPPSSADSAGFGPRFVVSCTMR